MIPSSLRDDVELLGLAGRTAPFSDPFDLNVDAVVDLKDFSVLASQWLDELLWPARIAEEAYKRGSCCRQRATGQVLRLHSIALRMTKRPARPALQAATHPAGILNPKR